MTSLKDASSKHQLKANQIRMEWRTSENYGKVLILVEGPEDSTFYFKFFNRENSSIRNSGGCGTLKGVYSILRALDEITCIAIKDSDFDRINGVPVVDENFFYADNHDYEMMCLSDRDVCKTFFENLGIDPDEGLIDLIIDELRYLSFFKWYNYTYTKCYIMARIKVDSEDMTADKLKNYDFLHTSCYNPASSHGLIEKDDLDDFIERHQECSDWEFINGHDFIQRLCFYLKSTHHKNNLNEEKLKFALYPCFDMNAFQRTLLYGNIRRWEVNNGKPILKPVS